MKTIALFFILTIAVLGQYKLAISPGVKIGLAFGEEAQFIYGYELSFVVYNLFPTENRRYGVVLDYDRIGEVKRLHIGFEYMYRSFGVDIGPSFAWKKSKFHYGFSIIPFGGTYILPYINYTHIKGIDDHFDTGTYIKIPFPLTHTPFENWLE
ncbi:MAG: hypothetical protein Q8M94_22195 [Ignavibacteria bacterium]|nr:hypothetical protein [Ignavibacteria bacterium]